jgi:hypothetical protein
MPAHICPMFMARPLDSRLRRRFQNPRRILAPHVLEGMTVLDFGCGPGFLTVEAAELVGERGRVIAADLQQPMLDIIAKKIAGEPTKVTQELATLVRPGGRLFLMEPKMFHVSKKAFERTVGTAEDTGMRVVDRPKVVLSWTAVLEKEG